MPPLVYVARKFVLLREMRDGKLELERWQKYIRLLSKKFILHGKLRLIKILSLTILVYFIDVIYSKMHTAFLSCKR